MKRKTFLHATGASLVAGSWIGRAAAQDYPTRPIRILLGFGAGGSSDQFARDLARWVGERLGQPMVVENKPGAATTIATSLLFNSPPDGYTLSVVSSHFAATPKLYPSLPYDVSQLTPIGLQVIVPALVVTNPKLGVNTLQQLVALAKAKPDALSYGSTGNGGVVHLSTERFKMAAGINMVHVPYKSDGDATLALMRGDLAMQFGAPSTCIPHIKAGNLKPLAWSSLERAPALPDVPTIAESGYPGFSSVAWFGLIGPPKMPKVIVDRLSREVLAVMAMPEMANKIRAQGMQPVADSSPEKFAAYLKSEAEKWGAVVVATGVKADG